MYVVYSLSFAVLQATNLCMCGSTVKWRSGTGIGAHLDHVLADLSIVITNSVFVLISVLSQLYYVMQSVMVGLIVNNHLSLMVEHDKKTRVVSANHKSYIYQAYSLQPWLLTSKHTR